MFLRTLIPLLATAGLLCADVKLPAIFSDHAVLQKSAKVPVWGKAEAGEKVNVRLGNASAEAVTGADGKWKALLDLSQSGEGPFELTVEGKNRLVVADVLVGEVWVCSGQSNMEVKMCQLVKVKADEIPNLPRLRQFIVDGQLTSATPKDEVPGKWQVADPTSTGNFTSVGYYFGEILLKDLKQPVGLLLSAWGGTPIEPWIPLEAYQADAGLAAEAAAAMASNASPATVPSMIYNAMIHPLVPYGIRGAIWYQGESNAGDAPKYRKTFPMLIQGWRKVWNQGDFPFYFCQLANFGAKTNNPAESGWADLRDAQLQTTSVPNTGQAVLIDIGESGDIHPQNKADVGKRLALLALARTYDRKIVDSGPVYQSMKIEGPQIRLQFASADGLMAQSVPGTYSVASVKNENAPLVRNSPNSELEGFAICGADQKWVWADAKIEGDTVIVSSPAVLAPTAARYGWSQNPNVNLYNRSGLPASPFQTGSSQ